MPYLIMKSGERQITEGIEQLFRTLGEKETYKYLVILEEENIIQAGIRGKKRKQYVKRTRILHETKLCSRNIIKITNTKQSPLYDT